MTDETFAPVEPPARPTPEESAAMADFLHSLSDDELIRRMRDDAFELGRDLARAAIRAGSGYSKDFAWHWTTRLVECPRCRAQVSPVQMGAHRVSHGDPEGFGVNYTGPPSA